MSKELWVDIPRFEGLYQISNFGRVKSFKIVKSGKILSIKNKTGWYLSIVLKNRTFNRSEKIHRLVAFAFIENPNIYNVVNHKDGNKQNNHFQNLEWCTSKENVIHAMSLNPNMCKGMNFHNTNIKPKTIIQKSLKGKFIQKYKNSKEAFMNTGICARNILQVASRDEYKPGLTRKQAGGFIWEFESI